MNRGQKLLLRDQHRPVPLASTPREAQLLGVPWEEWKERPYGFRERQRADAFGRAWRS